MTTVRRGRPRSSPRGVAPTGVAATTGVDATDEAGDGRGRASNGRSGAGAVQGRDRRDRPRRTSCGDATGTGRSAHNRGAGTRRSWRVQPRGAVRRSACSAHSRPAPRRDSATGSSHTRHARASNANDAAAAPPQPTREHVIRVSGASARCRVAMGRRYLNVRPGPGMSQCFGLRLCAGREWG